MLPASPLLSTDRLADVFERRRSWLFAIMIFLTIGAGCGYWFGPLVDFQEVASKEVASKEGASKEGASQQGSPTTPDPNWKSGSPAARIPGRLPPREYHQSTTECLIVVEGEDLFHPANIAALRDVSRELESLTQVSRVFWLDQVPNLNMFGLATPILPREDASAEAYAAARERVMQHPLAPGHLISEDGKTLLMMVWLEWIHITDDDRATTDIIQRARETVANHPEAKLRLRLTGRVPLYLGAQRALDRGQMKFQIIGYVLVSILAIILFRGVSAVAIVAGAPALGIFWSFGWLRLFDQLDNPLTGPLLPVLVSMVGFTDGVHLIVHIRAARARGATPMEAAKSAIRNVGLACLLTSVTTAIGFGSLMLAESEMAQGFGRACAVGIMLSFFAVVSFIPLVTVSRLGRSIHRGHESDFVSNQLQRLAPLIDWILPRRWAISLISILITASLLGWALTQLRPDDRLSDKQPTGSEAYEALAHCDRVMGGIETIAIRVSWTRRVETAEVLDVVARARQIFEQESLVKNPLSVHDFIAQLPGASNRIAQPTYIALLPDMIQDEYFNSRIRRARVIGRVQDVGIAALGPTFSRIEKEIETLNQELSGIHVDLFGTPVHRGRQLFGIVVDLAKSLGSAAIIILIVLIIVYRSFTLGLVAIIPNTFPLVVAAAYLLIVGQPLEMASVCSFTVCLGIAVDDSIHFLSRYQQERQMGQSAVAAVRATFIGVGTALITTTLVLVAGFGTVLTAELPAHRTFAAMACCTIGAALVGDLIFLPALLLCVDRKSADK